MSIRAVVYVALMWVVLGTVIGTLGTWVL